MNPSRALVRFLWSAVIFLAFIGVAVAVRRSVVLLHPGSLGSAAKNNPAAALDAHFAAQRALTLAHVIPAMLFMILGPLQFVKKLRAAYPQIHRWSGRVFLLSSGVVAISGLRMALGKTIGGAIARGHVPQPSQFFGTAFWIGFILQTIAAELWIHYTRPFAVTELAVPAAQ